MWSFRGIVGGVIAVGCLSLPQAAARAQSCSISSTARGPLACSVKTTIRMSVRVPALIGVTVSSRDVAGQAPAAVVRAGLHIKTNRSYALQIASADGPTGAIRPALAAAQRVTWSTGEGRASLDATPVQIDGGDGATDGRDTVEVTFVREPQRAGPAVEPVRFLLTIVAP